MSLFLSTCVLAAAVQPQEVRWEEHRVTGADDQPLVGQLGRLRVPENRSEATGATIELAFVVYPSTNPDPGPPFVYLAGGPGGSGIEGCVGPATGRFVRLLQYGDVIGLDQRGTGLSVPNLIEGPHFPYQLPLDRVVTREDVIAADKESVAKMVAHWIEAGVDLSAYNSAESADDVDAVRAALGYEQVVPYGSSYGSHLALAYLRRHPERVARAVIQKVEGPDHTWKLPSQIQAQLELLHERVAADASISEHVPDLLAIVRELLAQLADEPAVVTLGEGGAGEVTVTCGPYDLQRALTSLLADRGRLEQIPAELYRLLQGDWTSVAETALSIRVDGLPIPMMSLMMDCSSGATPARRSQLEREKADPANLLADAIDGYYEEVCTACGSPDLGDGFRGPLECDAPVLFVSGELDARTPPGNVDEIASGFSNHVHVIVENVGHPAREVLSAEYRALQDAFLRGEAVESCVLSLPSLRFRPVPRN
jgi:pimeloyl-ACP methyl ester carboxylesterase